MSIASNLSKIYSELPSNVKLVAVSKFKPASDIEEAYAAGQRCFAESRPKELAEKAAALPKDIEWHFIGHLQTNKIKYVLPWAALIQSVDSLHLLQAIEDACAERGCRVAVLLELHVASEATKQGFSGAEALEIVGRAAEWPHVEIRGFMAMATFTSEVEQVRREFEKAREVAVQANLPELSMGMSDDWHIALGCGTTMVRIGSAIFGARNYN